MEDTLIAINTGYARLGDGTELEKSKGKVYLINPEWRDKMDEVVELIQNIRMELQHCLGLDRHLMLYNSLDSQKHYDMENRVRLHFASYQEVGRIIDNKREKIREIMKPIMDVIGHARPQSTEIVDPRQSRYDMYRDA